MTTKKEAKEIKAAEAFLRVYRKSPNNKKKTAAKKKGKKSPTRISAKAWAIKHCLPKCKQNGHGDRKYVGFNSKGKLTWRKSPANAKKKAKK